MKTELFDYELPPERIAQFPAIERDQARLLVLEKKGIDHRGMSELPELVPQGALVVLNDTRVRKARLFGKRAPGGGRVELLLLDRLQSKEGLERWSALARANRPVRVGTRIELTEMAAEVVARDEGGTLQVALSSQAGTPLDVERVLERQGHVPLPPYVRREDQPVDAERYQTVYARHVGSSAAPTAGLHLSERTLERLRARGVEIATLTLHVGLGTFRPVTADDLDDHVMHSEELAVSAALARAVEACRARGAPVVAVGTTVVRALESASDPERPRYVKPLCGQTSLLIVPGYPFRVVDALLTNFHVPKSTLLALVAAFAGRERVLASYAAAVALGYRFLSYGDAMWIPERLTA